jgi:ferredoxin--NADP+ reductase
MGSRGIDRPEVRVAVVGSGPAGFFAAGHLLARTGGEVGVDLFDRLPTPWGLVRSGVAPDRQKLKAVSAVFEATAAHPAFRFFGNVRFGSDLTRRDLLRHYHAVVYAFGAEGERRLGIPGEDLRGSHSAGEFVGWYNGHPDCDGATFDLSGERAIVVGNGNVALDLARILALPVEKLARTDVADSALARLGESRVREIVVAGRRGPAEAAFTSPELSELALLPGVRLEVHDKAALGLALGGEVSRAEPQDSETHRKLEILGRFPSAHAVATGAAPGGARTIEFRFLCSPVEIRGAGRVEEIVLQPNELYWEGNAVRARPRGGRLTLATGLVLYACGYRGIENADLPFDAEQGVISHRGGRVLAPDGRPARGEYCAGWVKRGPQGVIGTNKRDAGETVTALLADLQSGALNVPPDPGPRAHEALLVGRGVAYVDLEGWRRIDTHERNRGATTGRPRVKLCGWDDLLGLAHPPAGASPVDPSGHVSS